MTNIKIREARENEIQWVNKQYAEIDFKESNFENELIVIAEIENLNCGLGRIVKINHDNYELGGIYVFQAFRNKGVAEKIVEFLICSKFLEDKTIWCLPFENLEKFYTKFGFTTAEKNRPQPPKEIIEKYNWCNNTYEKKVLLMVKENSFSDR